MAPKLTVWFTSDTHGYLYPTDFSSSQPRPQGLFSMSFPKDGNTLVIDGGDSLQGSPLTVRCRQLGRRAPVAEAFNRLGLDFYTLGNHDFNDGTELLGEHMSACRAQCLCGNIRDRAGKLPILPHTLRVMENGLRVGLFGICTDWVTHWEKAETLRQLTVTDPMEAARGSVRALREQGAEVVIGICHCGVEKDTATGSVLSDTGENIACRLAEELEIDLLLTGHQHSRIPSAVWNGTHLVQPGSNGTHFIRVTMDEDHRFVSELIAPERPGAVPEEYRPMLEDLEQWLDRPIGRLSRALTAGDRTEMAMNGSAIADLYNTVQLDATGAELSCTALPNEVYGYPEEVSIRNVVTGYPYANTLVVKHVTGAALRQALERCASYFDTEPDGSIRISDRFLKPVPAHFNYDYFMGLDYVFDLNRPVGFRVTGMVFHGKDIAPEDTFTLCMNNFRASGNGGYECWRDCPTVFAGADEVCGLIQQYILSHPEVNIPEIHPIRTVRPAGRT